MRAAVIEAPGRMALVDAPAPDPAPHQVLIRMEGCGICGSDLAVWEGRPWFEYPLDPGAPGHEGWGVVEAVGHAVASSRYRGTPVKVGQRVAAISFRAHRDLDVADASALVPLPDGLDGPFPGEAIGCAMNVFARSGIGRGTTVAVVGIGFMGALVTQLAVNAGARVFAVSRRTFALGIAKRCGAETTFGLDDAEAVAPAVADLTGGDLCDVVVEAAGRQSTLDLATELVRVRGRLVVAGYHQDGHRNVNMQLWNWRGLDVINAHERDQEVYARGVRAAVDAVMSGAIDLEPLITHSFPLTELDRALEMMRQRPDGFLKAVVQI